MKVFSLAFLGFAAAQQDGNPNDRIAKIEAHVLVRKENIRAKSKILIFEELFLHFFHFDTLNFEKYDYLCQLFFTKMEIFAIFFQDFLKCRLFLRKFILKIAIFRPSSIRFQLNQINSSSDTPIDSTKSSRLPKTL